MLKFYDILEFHKVFEKNNNKTTFSKNAYSFKYVGNFLKTLESLIPKFGIQTVEKC